MSTLGANQVSATRGADGSMSIPPLELRSSTPNPCQSFATAMGHSRLSTSRTMPRDGYHRPVRAPKVILKGRGTVDLEVSATIGDVYRRSCAPNRIEPEASGDSPYLKRIGW